MDLDQRKPIAFLEKRNQEVIAEYLQRLGSEILNQIEEVIRTPELNSLRHGLRPTGACG